jgi:hypothetical protein
MDRRALLQGLLTLPAAPMLDGIESLSLPDCNSLAQAPAILHVILDGAFTVVLRADSFWTVEAFSPSDPMHVVRFFGSDIDETCQQVNSGPLHFALRPDGLKEHANPPAVNACLGDFRASTDRWCRGKYAVTVSLPAPRNITLIPPPTQVTLANRPEDKKSDRSGPCLTSNYMLEYEITASSQIKMAWQQEPAPREFSPMKCEKLSERYRQACEALKKKQENNPKMMLPPQCSAEGAPAFQAKYSFCKPGDLVFFFGVGLPPGSGDRRHAVAFFNETLRGAFPDLQRFAIEAMGQPCQEICQSDGTSGESRKRPQPHLMEVSQVVDCHLAGILVTQPKPAIEIR